MLYIGFLLIAIGIILSVWASVNDKPFFSKIFLTSLLIVFIGIIIIFYYRIEEITIDNIGSIKTAVKKANTEANEIEKIRNQVQKHNKFAESVADEINIAQKQIEQQASRISELAEDATKSFQQIQKMEGIFDSMREYGGLARINFSGSIPIGGGIATNSPLGGWNKDFVFFNKDQNAGTYRFEGDRMCASEALDQYRSITKKYPFWPFSHFILAFCLKRIDDNTWEEHAKKAHDILEKTTSVPNHHYDHSLALNGVKQLLQN